MNTYTGTFCITDNPPPITNGDEQPPLLYTCLLRYYMDNL